MFRALVVGTLPIDMAYFQAHPNAWEYTRAPLPDEWDNLPIAVQVSVRVYLITCQCVVHALEGPHGEQLMTVIDSEETPTVLSRAGADTLPDWSVGSG